MSEGLSEANLHPFSTPLPFDSSCLFPFPKLCKYVLGTIRKREAVLCKGGQSQTLALQLGPCYIMLIIPGMGESERESSFCSWHLVSGVTHWLEAEREHWTLFLKMTGGNGEGVGDF